MTRSIHRSLLASMALLAAGCGPEEKCAPIDPKSVSVELGTGGLWANGRWTRVLVRARTKEKLFRGEVEVSAVDVAGHPSPERYRKRFEVAGETQAVEIPVLPRDWGELRVTFRGEGIPEETVSQRIPRDPAEKFRILIIGKPRHVAPLPPKFNSNSKEIEIKSVADDDLPLSFLGYQAADLVIALGDSLLDMDRDRLHEIRQWVERGGTIALIPAPKWSGKPPGEIMDLFGLARASRRDDRPGEAGAGPLLILEPLPGARLVDHGLLLENRFGTGMAYTHAFAQAGIFPGAAPAPEGVSQAWGKILARANVGSQEEDLFHQVFEPEALRVLSEFSGLRYPSRNQSILFVVGYLAIAFVFSGLFFGRARRLERMYVLAAFLAVLSSLAIWRFGILSAIQEFGVDQVAVARVRPGTPLADARTHVGLSSPTRRLLKLERVEDPVGSWIPSQPPANLLPLDYQVQGHGIHISEIPLPPNATRFLLVDGPLDLGGKLEAQLGTGAGGMPLIKVKNSTRFPLSLHLITYSGCSIYDLKSLRAGESSVEELIHPNPSLFNFNSRSFPGFERAEGKPGQLQSYLLKVLLSTLARSRKSGGAYLVAAPEGPLVATSFLGPVRHSLGFLILEVVSENHP